MMHVCAQMPKWDTDHETTLWLIDTEWSLDLGDDEYAVATSRVVKFCPWCGVELRTLEAQE